MTLQAGDPRSLLGGKPVTSVVVRELLTGRTATGYLTDEEYARAITETLPSRTAYADWAEQWLRLHYARPTTERTP